MNQVQIRKIKRAKALKRSLILFTPQIQIKNSKQLLKLYTNEEIILLIDRLKISLILGDEYVEKKLMTNERLNLWLALQVALYS